MSLIVVSQAQDGVTGVNAASINTPINTIANDYNGNITDANIANNAAISGSKVNIVTVSNPYKFSVYRNTALNSSNALTAVPHDTKTFDTSSNIDVVTNKGRFTAPVSGFYWFNALAGNTTAGTDNQWSSLMKNGSEVLRGNANVDAATPNGTLMGVTGILQLTAGDYVEHGFLGGNGSTMSFGTLVCYFQGYLVSGT